MCKVKVIESHTSIENLFRHESSKLIAVLTKVFGPHNLQLAEDVVQDSLLKALEHWKFHGMPKDPSAWLFTVARNKALDVVRKEKYNKGFAKEISSLLKSEYTATATLQEIVSPQQIEDEQLRMMFVCCHPSVAEEGQVALILKTLCGFSTAEIAHAFFTNEETITKRLYRAKEQFRQQAIAFELPGPEELQSRLENVLTAIYLIFNEGYHASHNLLIVREELIEESLRLGKMLVENQLTQRPAAYALLALLCFNAARVHGRVDQAGNLVQLREQDRTKWNAPLIEQGNFYLNRASQGNEVTPYHLEAAIAYEHCCAAHYHETNWARIVELYEWLYQLKPMPIVQLNQLIALAEWKGEQVAFQKLTEIDLQRHLKNSSLLFATLAEWHARQGNRVDAAQCLNSAISHSKSESEKRFFEHRLRTLNII
ncbi:MAG: RNA polymerase sigma factor [Bacteroidota bacterium]|nr:sigma-70 family RNA polymerase sigma factor [Cytophagales bacterium]MCE2955689.1 sigma-70 family RNA polymerase sigma factor [Flammeovirgaceae bacterium]MCZ8070697.1 sigma-70 family RNA polymerase sigma factor [Cytophagales bacterium]